MCVVYHMNEIAEDRKKKKPQRMVRLWLCCLIANLLFIVIIARHYRMPNTY